MSDPGHDPRASGGPPKSDPEALVLRARPRRVARFDRRVVIGVAAVACVLVFAATMIALYPPSMNRGSNGTDLLNTDRKQIADGLATLPSSYGDLVPKPPKLGPPLPGDLGPPVTHVEQNLGVAPQPAQNFGLRPNPEEDAARAERMRLARQAQEALESKVFFAVSLRSGQAGGVMDVGNGTRGSAAPATLESMATPARLELDPNRDANNQQRKLDFLNGNQDDRAIYNSHGLQHPVSPYQVMAGTLISASLITGLNSDLPGLVVAQVTENVYDTVTGRTLLIPQGARLIGTYDSVVAFGQSRALVVWQRIITPNGSSIVIDNLPATDTSGYAGLEDEVDYHTWTLLKGIALSTLLGVGSQVTFGSQQSNLVEAIRESTRESTNQAGQRIVEKDLNIQPTITVRPDWPLRVIVHKDLVLQPYQG
jgi:type IV secretory pathway VirB10-like protein